MRTLWEVDITYKGTLPKQYGRTTLLVNAEDHREITALVMARFNGAVVNEARRIDRAMILPRL